MEKYKKVKIVGKGSFGHAVLVHAIENPSKLYIVKVIDVSKMERKQKEEALNEVHILKAMRHPYVVTYRESFIEKRCLCIVMDYADGGDLYTKINQHKKTQELFSEDQILDWFVQIALSLKYIHDRKILHRDIKTQNIFLTSSGEIKLGDFGIARILRDANDHAKTAIGTPYYLSPEICQEKPYNQKSDIWSLGCILYELTTLNHAFDSDTMKGLVVKILKGTYSPIASHFSDNLRNLIAEMLTKDPTARPSIKTILQKDFLFNRIGKVLKTTLAKHKFQDLSVGRPLINQTGPFDSQTMNNEKERFDLSSSDEKNGHKPTKAFKVWEEAERMHTRKNGMEMRGTIEDEEQKTLQTVSDKEMQGNNIKNIINENLSLLKNPKHIFYKPQLLSKFNLDLKFFNIISNNLNKTPESELFGISKIAKGDLDKIISEAKNDSNHKAKTIENDESDMLISDPRLDRAQNIRRHLSNKIGADILASAIRILEFDNENQSRIADVKKLLGEKGRSSIGLIQSLITIEQSKSSR